MFNDGSLKKEKKDIANFLWKHFIIEQYIIFWFILVLIIIWGNSDKTTIILNGIVFCLGSLLASMILKNEKSPSKLANMLGLMLSLVAIHGLAGFIDNNDKRAQFIFSRSTNQYAGHVYNYDSNRPIYSLLISRPNETFYWLDYWKYYLVPGFPLTGNIDTVLNSDSFPASLKIQYRINEKELASKWGQFKPEEFKLILNANFNTAKESLIQSLNQRLKELEQKEYKFSGIEMLLPKNVDYSALEKNILLSDLNQVLKETKFSLSKLIKYEITDVSLQE